MDFIMETNRLAFRKLEQEDFSALCTILGDPKVMYAWEHGFNCDEVQGWIDRNRARYQTEGYGYFAVIEKTSGKLIGNIGLINELINGTKTLCLGYILKKDFWQRGYAVEGAKACLDYAFKYLLADQVTADIRPQNLASCRVAEQLGMHCTGEFVKIYQGKEMPHLIYVITRED